MSKFLLRAALAAAVFVPLLHAQSTGFRRALKAGESAFERGDLERAGTEAMRALERDAKSVEAWNLFARWAEAMEDVDRQVWARHKELRNATIQGHDAKELARLRETLEGLDDVAGDVLDLEARFVKKLVPLAEKYEKEGRPHSAIRVHKEILAIAPTRTESADAIQRIASAPDPSLAADAKPKDLLADVSAEWVAEHDAAHADWSTKAKLERENYTTYTDAGYEVLVRSAEAMEQMNAFYRVFFEYGTEEHGGSVPRIDLNIFKDRDEYLDLGIGPPVEWSAGHFTGGAVETYIGAGGFEGMVGTLFHEAAHQFVSLSTNAVGWLNEGLASFFEGCRILPNGTVLMNLPANHRLFPLVERLRKGWMADHTDGIDLDDPSKSNPEKAPTFRIVLENRYQWGPPWYAPTWGVVYFLYNYQDPGDGRFVYRRAFREFIDTSGGRSGEGAVENFEEVVLGQPAQVTKGYEPEDDAEPVRLPKTTSELDEVWKDWLLALADEASGRLPVEKPYLRWARYAIDRGDLADAQEHFEKGLVVTPESVDLLQEFADFLVERKDPDRATKLLAQAARVLEAADPVDEQRLKKIDRALDKLDPRRKSLDRVRVELLASVESLVQRYLAAEHNHMAMDLAWRFGTDFESPELFGLFEEALARAGRSAAIWKLAYNEENLDGWDPSAKEIFEAAGELIDVGFGEYSRDDFQYRFLTLNELTDGDFSMEAEMVVEPSQITFCGIVFGRKSDTDFHAALVVPPSTNADGKARRGFVDVASFYGGDSTYKTWIHSPIIEEDADTSRAERWRKLRVDVTGRVLDVWLDDEFVATHEFPSKEVVRGRFGLITGVGKSRFKNVRYLARAARDPGSLMERELRMRIAAPEGQSKNGSWLGQVPPFPKVASWASGSATSWEEAGNVPTLFCLWSIDQNDYIRLDEWLTSLTEKHADIGLRVVSVVNGWDADKVARYLETHPFPGPVGIDQIPAGQTRGGGLTYVDYAIKRFQLPRLLLLDLNHEVVWEGDPGFKGGVSYEEQPGSYLDEPLAALIANRKLAQVQAWKKRWSEVARPALASGDFDRALPVLREAADYDWKYFPAVLEANSRLSQIEAALAGIESLAAEWARVDRAVATNALLAWAEALETPVDKRTEKLLKKHLSGAKNWKRALGALTPLRKKLEAGKALGSPEGPVGRLEKLGDAFSLELAEQLRTAKDEAALRKVVEEAPMLPARWVAREHFGW